VDDRTGDLRETDAAEEVEGGGDGSPVRTSSVRRAAGFV
jgi:hypothetical protein